MPRKSRHQLPPNVLAIAAARAIDGRRTEWRIKGAPGLILRVMPSGVATYYVFYSARIGRAWKNRRVRLGRRGALSFSDAKAQAISLLRQVRLGADPAREYKKCKANTFRELAERRLAQDNNISERTKEDYRNYYERDVYPAIGDIAADNVSADMIVMLLDNIEKRAPRLPDKVKASIGSVYKWARKHQIVERDPTSGLGNRCPVIFRDRILTDKEINTVWFGVESGAYSSAMRLIIKILLLTGQRESEVAGAMVSELHLDDAGRPTWRLGVAKPHAQGGKRGRTDPHIVPLSGAAAKLFQEAISINAGSAYVFPAVTSSVRSGKSPKIPHIRGDSVVNALARLRENTGLVDVAANDLRRTMIAWLERQRVPPHILNLVLGRRQHPFEAKEITFAKCEDEVRSANELWAAHVAGLTKLPPNTAPENAVGLP